MFQTSSPSMGRCPYIMGLSLIGRAFQQQSADVLKHNEAEPLPKRTHGHLRGSPLKRSKPPSSRQWPEPVRRVADRRRSRHDRPKQRVIGMAAAVIVNRRLDVLGQRVDVGHSSSMVGWPRLSPSMALFRLLRNRHGASCDGLPSCEHQCSAPTHHRKRKMGNRRSCMSPE